MFQDIAPHNFDNRFQNRLPRPGDYVIAWRQSGILLHTGNHDTEIPTLSQLEAKYGPCPAFTYLFSVDRVGFFLCDHALKESENFSYRPMDSLTTLRPEWMGFSAATAAHLARWYEEHRFCGKCGSQTVHSQSERSLVCPACDLTIYPSIAPVVIVAVTDGDRLLLTRYARGGYRRHALVAGFAEIGETLEDAARREVREETGMDIKNLRYYKSQPWAFSQSLLSGFFAEADGDKLPVPDRKELSEAVWYSREDIPQEDSTLSLTWDMIEAFRQGKIR